MARTFGERAVQWFKSLPVLLRTTLVAAIVLAVVPWYPLALLFLAILLGVGANTLIGGLGGDKTPKSERTKWRDIPFAVRVFVYATVGILGWSWLTNSFGEWAADNGSNDPVGSILFWAVLFVLGWFVVTYLVTKGVLGSSFGSYPSRQNGAPRGEGPEFAQRQRDRRDHAAPDLTDEEWRLIEAIRKERARNDTTHP